MAMVRINNCFTHNDLVVLTGGTGLYLDAFLFGVDSFPDVPREAVEYYDSMLKEQGINALKADLQKLDPDYYKSVDLNNPSRLIRALSVCKASGHAYSSFRKRESVQRKFDFLPLVLEMNRSELYKRIDERVEQMLQMGLMTEAKGLFSYRDLKALDTVGYKELFGYFDRQYSFEDAIELIKRNSRRYAKRQITWLRKYEDWPRFQPFQNEEIFSYIDANL
jgi:tRNA dimethylallyltransferase